MNYFGLDASALAKRYTFEVGADRIDHLFGTVVRERLLCLMLGAAEVVSVLVRRRNAGLTTQAAFTQGMNNFWTEVINDKDFDTLAASKDAILSAFSLIESHSINANDAVVLRVFLDRAVPLRAAGDDLVLVAADQRLLRAAQAEALATFDPENQSLAELDGLIKA